MAMEVSFWKRAITEAAVTLVAGSLWAVVTWGVGFPASMRTLLVAAVAGFLLSPVSAFVARVPVLDWMQMQTDGFSLPVRSMVFLLAFVLEGIVRTFGFFLLFGAWMF
jgi:phosphate/sulfate permease